MIDCNVCPDHGALKKELEYLSSDLNDTKKSMKELIKQMSDLNTEMLKLEGREKLMLGIFALAGTILSSIGSVIGCFITAYIK